MPGLSASLYQAMPVSFLINESYVLYTHDLCLHLNMLPLSMLHCDRLKAELEKIKPARETPARGRPAKKGGPPSAYNQYVKQNFASHKKDGMATTAVRTPSSTLSS